MQKPHMAPGASLVRTNRLSVRSVRGQRGAGGLVGAGVRRGGADPWDRADLKPRTVRRGGGRRDAAGCDRVQTWSGPARAAHSACAIINAFLTVVVIFIIMVVVVILTWDGKWSEHCTVLSGFCKLGAVWLSQVSCIYHSVYKLSWAHAACCCLLSWKLMFKSKTWMPFLESGGPLHRSASCSFHRLSKCLTVSSHCMMGLCVALKTEDIMKRKSCLWPKGSRSNSPKPLVRYNLKSK